MQCVLLFSEKTDGRLEERKKESQLAVIPRPSPAAAAAAAAAGGAAVLVDTDTLLRSQSLAQVLFFMILLNVFNLSLLITLLSFSS